MFNFWESTCSFILHEIHFRKCAVIFLILLLLLSVQLLSVYVCLCVCMYVYVCLCIFMNERLLLVVCTSGAICWVFHQVISNRINYRYIGFAWTEYNGNSIRWCPIFIFNQNRLPFILWPSSCSVLLLICIRRVRHGNRAMKLKTFIFSLVKYYIIQRPEMQVE